MNILNESMPVVINLAYRVDRKVHMMDELKRVQIKPYILLPGKLPDQVLVNDPKAHLMRYGTPQRKGTPGAIGCYVSQMKAMEMAHKHNLHAFVMEDDLIFCDDFKERMGIASAFLTSKKWHVLWLGATFHINPPYWHKTTLRRDAETTAHPNMMRTYGAFSTHAYIVNRSFIPEILKELDNQMPTSIGIDYSFIRMQPQLHCYAFVPGCVIQMDNQSDIGRGITKFSGFAKLGPYWFQKKMADFDPIKFDWKEAKAR